MHTLRTRYTKMNILSAIFLLLALTSIGSLLLLPTTITADLLHPKQPITIGALLPLSGPNSTYGNEMRQGIELAVQEINSHGGITGTPLAIIFEDDAATPATGVSAATKLTTINHVPVILGPWASSVALAVAPLTENTHTILFASAIAPALSVAGEYTFRIQPSAAYYTKESTHYLFDKNLTTTAILYTNNDFGKALLASFVEEYQEEGSIVTAREAYAPGTTDFRSELAKVLATHPQVLFIAGYQETNLIIKQAHELGFRGTYLAGPPFESQATLSTLGSLAEGVLYPYHFVAGTTNPLAQEYEVLFLNTHHTPTGGFAPLMYDATNIVAQALQVCDTNTRCIQQALYATTYQGTSGTITFDANGDPQLQIVMKTVSQGKFVKAP